MARGVEMALLTSSSSQRRPSAIARTSVARVSARIGRWSECSGSSGAMISRRRLVAARDQGIRRTGAAATAAASGPASAASTWSWSEALGSVRSVISMVVGWRTTRSTQRSISSRSEAGARSARCWRRACSIRSALDRWLDRLIRVRCSSGNLVEVASCGGIEVTVCGHLQLVGQKPQQQMFGQMARCRPAAQAVPPGLQCSKVETAQLPDLDLGCCRPLRVERHGLRPSRWGQRRQPPPCRAARCGRPPCRPCGCSSRACSPCGAGR
jgi:hypothetical protein